MTRDLVFVSYSHLDTAWREQLHVMLKPWIYDGLKYWADDYIQVGDEWERKLEGAIERARVAVLLLSSPFYASRFIRERELPPLLAAAAQGALRVFCLPVEPCSYVIAELEHFQFPWRTALRSQTKAQWLEALAAVAKRIADEFELGGPVVATRASARSLSPVESGGVLAQLFGAPDLPQHYRARAQELSRLKAALLGGERGIVGIGAAARHGVQGIGGVGKTVLARALAGDEETRTAFPDGVFWLTFGQTPEVLQLQLQLARWLGDMPTFTNVAEARERLRGLLAEKRCLLVLDDLWRHEHSTAFEVLGPRGRLLVTTRDKQILSMLGADTTNLDVLDEDSALALLAQGADVARDALPKAAHEVAKECGRLPLALTLAAAQVRECISWDHVLAALRAGDLAFLDHPHGSVFKTLDASVRALSEHEAARYRELSFAPEDARVPEVVIARCWQHTAGLAPHESAKLLRRFAAKGLLSQHEGTATPVSFHDLQLDYLRLVGAQERLAHQRALLDAFAEQLPRTARGLPRWGALSLEHTYLWKNLSHHLLEAQRTGELKDAICDVRWIKGKIQTQGLASLLVELAQVVPRLFDPDCDHVERALRVDGGALYLEPTALESLLYARLRSEGWEASRILRTIADLAPPLRPRHPVYLGSRSERRRFVGHTGGVNACAYSPDGKRVISASRDGTLREWDAASGKETRRFVGHTDSVSACAYSPDGERVLSASADKTLREWDVETGDERQRFEGHTDGVRMCAYWS